MKYIFRLFSLCFFVSAAALHAESTNVQGTVLAVKGTASVSMASGQSTVKTGESVGVNTRIVTTPGAEVTVRLFTGTVVVVQPESEVTIEALSVTTRNGIITKEISVLNLTKGAVVTTLDPAKKDVSDYRVRTPRGVAVAHGTVFAVRVTQDQENATLSTMSGTVTFVTDRGEFTVSFGQVSNGSGVMTVAEAVAADPSLAQVLVNAATSVAAAIGAGNSGITSNQINTVLAAMVDVAAQASPSQAGEVAGNVLAAAAPALGANAAQTTQIIAAAAVAGAVKTDPTASDRVTSQVVSAVNNAVADAGLQVDPITSDVAAAPEVVANAGEQILPPLDQSQIVISPSIP